MTLNKQQQHRRKASCWAGTCLVILGSLSIAFAIFAAVGLPKLVETKVGQSLRVTSHQHPDYDHGFVTSDYDGAPQRFNSLYFFHLTNPNEFLDGEPPVLEERGPYMFQEHYKHQLVTFSDDGSTVSYADAITNTFVPTRSNGTLEDRITTLNLPYMKIMGKFGRETSFLSAAGIKALITVLRQMEHKLVLGVKAGATAQAISTGIQLFGVTNLGKSKLFIKMGGGCVGNDCSIRTWPLNFIREFVDTQVCSCDLVDCPCRAEAIPLETFQRLTDSADPMSFLNTQQDNGTTLWLDTSTPAKASDNKKALVDHFNLTDFQFDRLQMWLQNVSNSDYLRDQVFKKVNVYTGPQDRYKIEQWDDLVYRQLLKADVLAILKKSETPMLSVQESAPPEIAFFLDRRARQATSTKGLATTPEELGWTMQTIRCLEELIPANSTWTLHTFLNMTMARPGKREDFTRPSLDFYESTVSLSDCFPGQSSSEATKILAEYFEYLGVTVVSELLLDVIEQISGLITTRTVEELALGYQEPILTMALEKSDPRYYRHAMLPNDPSLDSYPYCRSTADMEDDYFACLQIRTELPNGTVLKQYVRNPSTYSTGKADMHSIGSLVRYHGVDSIDDVFLGGNYSLSEGAQLSSGGFQTAFSVGSAFPPFNEVNPQRTLAVFLTALMAPFSFVFSSTVSDLYGIEMHRFVIDKAQFTPKRLDAAMFDMRTQKGVFNGTEPKGFMLFVTNPHFAGFEDQLPKFQGIDPPDMERHVSYLDVEPITGKTMRAQIRVQVAVSTDIVDYDVFYPKVYKTSYMPVFWKEVSSELSPTQASFFVNSVYTAENVSFIGSIVGAVVGVIFLGSGTFLLYRYKKSATKVSFSEMPLRPNA